jgi:hypothetical protein
MAAEDIRRDPRDSRNIRDSRDGEAEGWVRRQKHTLRPFLSGMEIASPEYQKGQSSGGRRVNFMIL